MTSKKRAPVVTSAELDATPPGTRSAAQLGTQRIHTGKIIKLDLDHIRYRTAARPMWRSFGIRVQRRSFHF